MELKEAKEKYPGIKFKEKGFYNRDQTQLIYKSDLRGKNKLGFVINGNVHLLQDPLRSQLEMILKGEKEDVPAGIAFDSENDSFKIPLSYLPIITNEVVEVDKPVEKILPEQELTIGTYSAGSYQLSVLNKVAQTAAQSRFLESLNFYKSVILQRGDVEDQLEVLLKDFKSSPTEDNLSNLILTGILYLEMTKNDNPNQ